MFPSFDNCYDQAFSVQAWYLNYLEINENTLKCYCDNCIVSEINSIEKNCEDCLQFLRYSPKISPSQIKYMYSFVKLEDLIIIDSKFDSSEILFHLNSLRTFTLYNCDDIKAIHINSNNIEFLEFKNCRNLKYFSSNSNIKNIKIENCPELKPLIYKEEEYTKYSDFLKEVK